MLNCFSYDVQYSMNNSKLNPCIEALFIFICFGCHFFYLIYIALVIMRINAEMFPSLTVFLCVSFLSVSRAFAMSPNGLCPYPYIPFSSHKGSNYPPWCWPAPQNRCTGLKTAEMQCWKLVTGSSEPGKLLEITL